MSNDEVFPALGITAAGACRVRYGLPGSGGQLVLTGAPSQGCPASGELVDHLQADQAGMVVGAGG